MPDRNVLGGPLEPSGRDPLTGFYRTACCSTRPEDLGGHTICAVVTSEFPEHQRSIGNDLSTPVPRTGSRTRARRSLVRHCGELASCSHREDCAAPLVLACTYERTVDVVLLEALREHAVDTPDDLGNL
jgi:uncharacterized protein